MARNVDERIVEMQFNNKQFESGVKESIDSLDKLKHSLNFDGATQSFDKLGSAAGKINFNPIQNGIEVITQKFSALEIIGITALQRITNQVMDTGERLVKSFTIAPITQGWDKYEKKVESVQKILNSSADNTMPKVEAALEKIGWFTDETSYQFDAMVSTLGSFSAAGIELESATNTIIGLANAAAISGVNAQNASHGFLGFQRAIGSGYLSLGIWNSYLKTAGFQSQAFIDGCIKAAEEVGTLKKALDGTYQTAKGTTVTLATFGETLQEKWVNKDVITKMAENFSVASDQLYAVKDDYDMITDAVDDLGDKLDQYSLKAFLAGQETKTWGDAVEYVKGTVAQGWSGTWERIFGNYEDAKEFFGEIVELLYELFVVSGNTRNEILDMWKTLGGAAVFRKGLVNLLTAAVKAVHMVQRAFVQLFPIFGDQEGMAKLLNKLALRFEHVTKIASKAFDKIRDATTPVEKSIKRVAEEIRGANKAGEETAEVLASIAEMAKRVISGEFGNGQERIDQLTKLGYCYEEVQNQVNELLGNEFRYTDYKKKLTEATDEQTEANRRLSGEYKHVHDTAEEVHTTFENIVSTFRGVIAVYQIIVNLFQAFVRVASELIDPLKKIGDGILGVTGDLGDAIVLIKDYIIENDVFYKLLKKVADFIAQYVGPVFDSFSGVLEGLKNRSTGITKAAENLIKKFQGLFEVGEEVEETAVGIGTGLGNVHALLNPVVDLTGQLTGATKKAAKETSTFSDVISIISSALDIFWSILKGVGKAVSGFAGPALKAVANSLGTVGTFLKDLVNKKLDAKIFNLKSGIKDFFLTLIEGATGIENLKGSLQTLTKSKVFNGLFEAVFETDFSLGNLVQAIKDKLQELAEIFGFDQLIIIDPIKEFFGGIAKVMGDGVDAIKRVLSHIDFRKIFAAAGFSAFIFFVVQISRLSGAIRKFVGGLGDILQGIGGLFDGLATKLKLGAVTGLVWSITALIGAVVGSIYILSKLDPTAVATATGAIAVIVGVVGQVVTQIMTFSAAASTKGVALATGAMLAIGIMFLAIASAMNILIGMDFNQYLDGVAKLAGLFFALLAGLMLISRLGVAEKSIDIKSMAAFLIFVIALKNVVKAVLELSEADAEKTWKAIGMFGAIAVEMGILAKLLNGVTFTSGIGMAMMVISIKMFVGMLKDLTKTDFRAIYEVLVKMVPIFLQVLFLITFAQMLGDQGKSFAAVLLSIGIMFKLMASALTQISKIEPAALDKAIGTLGMMALVIIAVTAVVTALSSMKLTQNRLNQYTMMFVAIGIALVAVAAALKILSGLDWNELWPAAIALGGVIMAVGLALRLAGNAKLSLKPALSMAIMIGVVCGALLLLVYLVDDWDKLKMAALALGGVIAAVSIGLIAIGKIDFGSALSSALAMSLVILAVVGAFYYLTQMDSDSLLAAAISMGLIIAEVSAAIIILGMIPWSQALMAAANFATFMVAITGVMAGLAGLLKDVEGKEIEKGLDNLVLIFTKLGETIGGLFSGLLEGLTNRLPQVGENLSNFADHVKKFIDTFSDTKISWKTIFESTAQLVNALSNLKKVSISEDETGAMNTAMEALGHGMATFYTTVTEANINVMQTKKAAEAIEILFGLLEKKPKFNVKGWGDIGTSLESLGDGIVKFSNSVSGNGKDINTQAVNKALRVITNLVDIAQDMGSLEGFEGWGKLLQFSSELDSEGNQDLSGLTKLAKAIVGFNNEMKTALSSEEGFDSTYLTAAIRAVKDLVTIAGDVPNAGGQLAEWFGGFQGWTTISTDLESLGSAIAGFSEKTGGIDQTKLDNGFAAIKSLNELAKSFDDPFTGGIIQKILGDNTLGGLAEALMLITPKLVSFATISRGLKPEETARSFTILNNIVKAANDIYGVSLTSAGYELDQFATYFKTAYETMASTDADTSYIQQLISSFRDMFNADTIQALGEIGRQMAEAMTTAFSSDPALVQDSVNTFVSYYVNNFVDHTTDFEETGEALRLKFSQAFSGAEARNMVNGEVDTMASEMVSKIREYNSNMFNAGSYLVDGLISGIDVKIGDAAAKADQLGSAVDEAFRKHEHIYSPSRIWFGFGSYMIQGLINGIDENMPTAVNQIRALADAMNGIFDDTIDLEASADGITPVFQSTLDSLDTSSLARRASGIESARDYNSAMAATTNRSFTIQNLNVTGTDGMSVNELSDAVIDKLNRAVNSENSRWAF